MEILENSASLADGVCLIDHINGFDEKKSNRILDHLNQSEGCNRVVWHEYVDSSITSKYPNLAIEFDADLQNTLNLNHFHNYRIHPENTFENFLCSFNGAPHVGRKLLVAILQRMGWFDSRISSKNFDFTADILDGHLADFFDREQHRLYRSFFLDAHSETFFRTVNDLAYPGHDISKITRNIYNIEHQITSSFLHVVSETMSTSYYPFVTEKFLYSIITRGLFLAYAQPGWHDHLEMYYGFRKYKRIFDYRFDLIQNPVLRLVELMSMISKFSVLSSDEWRNIYEMEIDTIEFNYDHYFSGNYLKVLRCHA